MSVEPFTETWTITAPVVSVVVPFLNEEATLATLHARIAEVMGEQGIDFELIFIDDGSCDDGTDICRALARAHDNVTVIVFRRNFGKAAALSAGFREARGAIVVTMDADLQDDPAELPRFVEAIEGGADVVCGWKQERHDPLGKTLPSGLFNAVVNRVFGLRLRDHNCGFKAYRCEALNDVNLYGELHRFIPALLQARGYRIAELPVRHRAREHGVSKYGMERLVKGALDLLTVALTTRFGARPLHMFGVGGLVLGLAGAAILAYLTILWLIGEGPIGDRPLLMLGMLLVLFGGQMIGTGLLGELFLARSIRENDKYDVREIVGAGAQPKPAKDARSRN